MTKLNAKQISRIEKHYGSLEVARNEYRRLRAEQLAADPMVSGKVLCLVGGRLVLWFASEMTDAEFGFAIA